jgi:hypothetical protein
MPTRRRGLNEQVQLKALEEANERAAVRLRVTATEGDGTPSVDGNQGPKTKASATAPRAVSASQAPGHEPAARPEPPPGTPAAEALLAERDPAAAGRASRPRAAAIERGLWAALVAGKVATVAFGVEALVNGGSKRFKGKAMRVRALGYLGALCIVPLGWRLLPDRSRYPRGLDTAVTIPLLLDAAGNGLGIYDDAHVDDIVHFANTAIAAGVAGALVAPRVDERWHAAAVATGLAITAETLWEIMEYTAMRMGANGMNLSYDDTMEDIIDSTLGAIAGGLFTLTRVPRSREDRKRAGWRSPLGA